MTASRVYAAASGQCLVRDTETVDEAERERVLADFHGGVRLFVDEQEVRGFVPAKRSSAEAFVAVVDVNGRADPVDAFYETVEAVFDARDHWHIRTDVAEGPPFHGVPPAPESLVERVTDALASDDGGASTETTSVTVDSFADAVGVAADGHLAGRSVAVCREPNPSHLDVDVLLLVREETTTAGTPGATSEAADGGGVLTRLRRLFPAWFSR